MAQTTTSYSLPSGASNEVRLILLGKTGAGKSSFGNTILGDKVFTAKSCPNSITTKCAIDSRLRDGKQIFVVDTPGFLDTTVTAEVMQKEVATSYQMTAVPGPHAFLLVVNLSARFTKEESEALKYLDKIFGPQAINHTIIIFTRSDSLDDSTIEEYLDELTPDAPLRDLLNQCQQRYITINNKGSQIEKDTAVKKLLEMVSILTMNNNGQVYRSEEFDAIAQEIAEAKSKGVYEPFTPDGTFNLLPQTKKIIIDGRLRRTLGRKDIK